MPMIETIAMTLFWLVFALMFVGAVLMSWIYRRLMGLHFEVWDRLGQPSLFLNASVRVQQRVGRFLWRSEYSELGDEKLAMVATVSKVLAVTTAFLVVTMSCLIVIILSRS